MQTSALRTELRTGLQEVSKQQSAKCDYTTNRVLDDRDNTPGRSYQQLLPRYDYLGIMEIIDNVVDRKDRFNLLDVGCGQAWFLVDIAAHYPAQANCFGTSTYPYHNPLTTDSMGIRIANSPIESYIPPKGERFDLITAAYSLIYSFNPMVALKRIFNLLEPEGIALIHPIPSNLVNWSDFSKWRQFLTETYSFEVKPIENNYQQWVSIAFQKRFAEQRLVLPMKPAHSKVINIVNDFHQPQVFYDFDPVAAERIKCRVTNPR